MKNTYIYVKQSPKGLLYLGKTVREPFSYRGSGKRWLSHLAKYEFRSNDCKTYILHETANKQELIRLGLYYSNLFNVVNSDQWANLKVEEGDGGATRLGMKNKKETNQKISESHIGLKHTSDTIEKLRIIAKNRIHTEESNKRRSETLSGRKRPVEVVEKIKKGLTGRKLSSSHVEALKGPREPYGKQVICKCEYCGVEGGKNSITRWHNDNCKHKNI